MKKLLLASAATALVAGPAAAEDEVKIGILLGYTGPIESLTPHMAESAELAISEVNESGMFLDGQTISGLRADSTCIDNSAATAAAERLVTSDGVVGIVGGDCSGITMAVLQNVAVPNGVPMISPSATSPAFSELEGDAARWFFRTSPSDARQGQILAQILLDHGYDSTAVSYTNNDYGQGFADSFVASFEELGGTVTLSSPHDDGEADFSSEVGALASAGGDILTVLGYADEGGAGIIQNAYESGAFDVFAMGDGMFSRGLFELTENRLEGTIGTVPGAEGDGPELFLELTEAAGVMGDSSFTGESYDAAALIMLAMQAGGEATRDAIADNVMSIANAPGEEIMPGELARGLEILADGGEIHYTGATNVDFIEPGEAAGVYREYRVEDGEFVTLNFR